MAQSTGNEKKRRRKGSASCSPMPARKIKVFNVGVYFPDRDLVKFEITSHEFLTNPKGDCATFFNIGELGMKEFVARLSHVAYVIVKEIKGEGWVYKNPVGADELPKDFGKVS